MGGGRRPAEWRTLRAARPLHQGPDLGLAADLEPRDGGLAGQRIRAEAQGARRLGPRPDVSFIPRFAILDSVHGVLAAIKADFACLLVAVLFIIIMASTIVFAPILTPPAHNPFV